MWNFLVVWSMWHHTSCELFMWSFTNFLRSSVHRSVVENHAVPYPMMPVPFFHLVLKALTPPQVVVVVEVVVEAVAVEAQGTMNILHYISSNLEIACIQKYSFCAQHLLVKSLACSLNWHQPNSWCSSLQKMLCDKRLKRQWSSYWVMDKSLHLRHL